MTAKPLALLRYLLRQSTRDKRLRSIVGTQAQVARALRVSASSLRRYLFGEPEYRLDPTLKTNVEIGRKWPTPPETFYFRVVDFLAEIDADVRAYMRSNAGTYEALRFGTDENPYIKAERYAVDYTKLGGEARESRILVVNVDGMTNAEVGRVIVAYWKSLKKTGIDWDIRFQVRVPLAIYKGESRWVDKSLRKLARTQEVAEIWIPPLSVGFVRQPRAGRRSMAPTVATKVLPFLNGLLAPQYEGRVESEYTFSKLAFIPLSAPNGTKRYQKRRGKR